MLLACLLVGCSDPAGGPDGPEGGFQGDGAQGGTGSATSQGTGASGASLGQGAGDGTGGTGEANCEDATPDTGATVLRRLSALEYRLTVQDLLALPEPPEATGIPLDTERLGFRTFAEYQTMSADNLRGYMDKAAGLAASLLADTSRRDEVIGCDTTDPDCLADFVTRFGKRAYRRPLETEEVDSIVSAATEFGTSTEDAFAFAIEALLSSAHFLYRVEVGDNPEGLSTLGPYELASKLSFALWGRGPSPELLNQAAEGALQTPEGLAATAEAMLADERTQTFFEEFFRQWLGYQTLKPPSAAEVAVFDDMQEETDRIVKEFAWGGGNFLDVLTANHTYVTPELASYYGLPEPAQDGRIDFAEGDPRAHSGILTHASLLSAKSDGDLIAIRGNWLIRTFLCEEIHIPPDLADTIGELLVGLDRVGIVEARNTRNECAGCHGLIDPIGIGFASFDRTGIFDPEEDPSIFGIDAALPLAPEPNDFSNVGELSAQIASLPEVPRCLTERAYLYMNGREPTEADECSIEQTSQRFAEDGHDLTRLLQALVEDPSFRLRRAPELTP